MSLEKNSDHTDCDQLLTVGWVGLLTVKVSPKMVYLFLFNKPCCSLLLLVSVGVVHTGNMQTAIISPGFSKESQAKTENLCKTLKLNLVLVAAKWQTEDELRVEQKSSSRGFFAVPDKGIATSNGWKLPKMSRVRAMHSFLKCGYSVSASTHHLGVTAPHITDLPSLGISKYRLIGLLRLGTKVANVLGLVVPMFVLEQRSSRIGMDMSPFQSGFKWSAECTAPFLPLKMASIMQSIMQSQYNC